MILVWFLIFAGMTLAVRVVARRRFPEERLRQFSMQADSVMGLAISALFAILVGFCINLTWGGIVEGQTLVEKETAAAEQVILYAEALPDSAASKAILSQTKQFLVAAGQDDRPYLVSGDVVELPSKVALGALQRTILQTAEAAPATAAATPLVGAAKDLVSAHVEAVALSRRALPPLVAILLIVNGLVLAFTMGLGLAWTKRPWLSVLWSIVAALAVAAVLTLDFPYAGSVSVDLSPLMDVARTLP